MLAACAIAPQLHAAPIDWAHLNGGITSNGSVTVKSLSGGTYAATQNPTGAIAKASQNAATQPPTVIIQATSSGLPFNYKDDCYLFLPPSGHGYQWENEYRVGIGKVDASNNFTGVAAFAAGPGYGNMTGAAVLFSALTGASVQNSTQYIWCTNAACVWNQTAANPSYIFGFTSAAVRSIQKCYP